LAKEEKTTRGFEEAALDLIESECTLTLSTAGADGPWSAPVYYVFSNSIFYFFSSPSSRHIQHALNSGHAAASLYHQSDAWQTIRGLQMTGTIEQVRSIGTAAKVIPFYLKRYPFTLNFFPEGSAPDLGAFSKRFKAKLYAFTPSVVYYTDNRFGFGNRQRIEPNQLMSSS
jgi:uncharacterized protein YhbP (UPF0306 family)